MNNKKTVNDISVVLQQTCTNCCDVLEILRYNTDLHLSALIQHQVPTKNIHNYLHNYVLITLSIILLVY